MSSMDTGNQLRSQEFVQRSEMQSQSLRQDSANQMTQGLGHTVEAMKQYAMMKAESDAKLQMFEQDMQLNALKIQHMQALDATDMAHEQLESMRLANRGQRLAVEQQEKVAKGMEKSGFTEAQVSIIKAFGGADDLIKFGVEPQPDGSFKRMDPELRKQLLAGLKNSETDAYRLRLADAIQYDDPQSSHTILEGLKAKEVPGYKPKALPPPKPQVDAKTEAELVPAQRLLGTIVKDPAQQKEITNLFWAHRATLAASYNRGRTDNRESPFSEKEAFDKAIEILADPSHPKHRAAREFLRSIGGPDIGYIPTPGIVAPQVLRGDIPR